MLLHLLSPGVLGFRSIIQSERVARTLSVTVCESSILEVSKSLDKSQTRRVSPDHRELWVNVEGKRIKLSFSV